jgi:hypothetical protein
MLVRTRPLRLLRVKWIDRNYITSPLGTGPKERLAERGRGAYRRGRAGSRGKRLGVRIAARLKKLVREVDMTRRRTGSTTLLLSVPGQSPLRPDRPRRRSSTVAYRRANPLRPSESSVGSPPGPYENRRSHKRV